MKKVIVFLMCLCFVMSGFSESARAYDECESVGGTEITRNVNGAANAPSTCTPEKCPATTQKFCKSGQGMNWWSAFNWCKSIGRSLAKFDQMCPNTQTAVNNTNDACPALKGGGGNNWVWSNVGFGSNSALVVKLSSGAVDYATHGRNANNGYALCE